MADFATKLRWLSERGNPVGAEELIERIEAELAGDRFVILTKRREGTITTKTRQSPLTSQRSRYRGPVWGVAAFVAVLAVGALVNVFARDGDQVADTTPTTGARDGWVAFAGDNDGVFLVRAGEPPRRVAVAGPDTADETCPAFAPDGERLMFGRATRNDDDGFHDAELVIVTVNDDGAVSPLKTIPLVGINSLPCAIWAPDGRWAAFGGAGAVWVVDTATDEVRQLPGYHPTDLEWRPGTDELAIAGHRMEPLMVFSDAPIAIYSVSTGEVRTLGDVQAAGITWSPDGETMAYTHSQDGDRPDSGIWLVSADGTNQRQLIPATGRAIHGIGVVWSPRGDLIAYQRVCKEHPEFSEPCTEQHEVVLVTATDDAATPIGSEVVIAPPQTDGANGPEWWFPFSVTWSPDGTQLLYTAWIKRYDESGEGVRGGGVIAVPIDTDLPPIILTNEIYPDGGGSPWVPIQQWGRSR